MTQCQAVKAHRLYKVKETPVLSRSANVLPDTTPPMVSGFELTKISVTNLPNYVPFHFVIVNAGSNGYWTDPENTNLTTSRIFDVTFSARSNEFVVAFSTTNLNTPWQEFPTSTNWHPFRSNQTNSLFFPIYTARRYYTLRSITNRTWNQLNW